MGKREERMTSYINRCIKDAFKAEGRVYDKKLFEYDWVMIKNHSGIFQFYFIPHCKYEKIIRRVEYRLRNNLIKNFGVIYGSSDEMACRFDEFGGISPGFTQVMLVTDKGYMSVDIMDKYTDSSRNPALKGECIPVYTYEKLLFKYWKLDADKFRQLPENDKRRNFPASILSDWEMFRRLYQQTFNEPIGSRYEVICSPGIERI